MKKYTTYYNGLALLFVLMFLWACSTTKNTFVTRTFHNINSRYNGLFYAKLSLQDAQDKIAMTYVDDYSQLLPLFRLPNTPETKGSFTDLEKAIKKATTCIEHHAITSKGGVEVAGAVKYIDDCYLVIGQAHYYKGEYLTALDIFDYMIQKYSKMDAKYDAMYWKARTQIELGAYTEAESLLDVVDNNPASPARLKPDVKATYAYLYIMEGNYANAIKYLEEAITLEKKKKFFKRRKSVLARYTYVLAQLYEKVGKEQEAYTSYESVIKMNPTYDMLFNAKLSRARLSASNTKNRTAAKKELQKMLTDLKNTEYKDQIYYTLGQLEQRSGNLEGARNYYRQSAAASVGNNKQKALSYLALGDMYFAETDYKTAQAYYDSTMTVLPKDYLGYKAISEKNKSLANLVKYINIVSTEDSLQRIAAQYGNDTTQLYKYIDKLIKQQQEEDKRLKEQQDNAPKGGTNIAGAGAGGASQGSFYFYNPSNVSFGVNEFTRKWGNRVNEDNWRRANKEQVIQEGNDAENGDTSTTAGTGKPKTVNDKYTRDYYVKNLPLTPDAVSKSDERIADALYNLGTLYKEQMGNNTKAADAFETLCKRYPNHKYALPSHFQLWRLYKQIDQPAKADEHKNYICGNFPQSEYCELIKNPDFNVAVQAAHAKIDSYYTETYDAYAHRNYLDVISRCNYADSAFGTKLNTNAHAAQFAYLRAVSLGKTQGTPAMESALTKIVANYPKDPMREQAQALLDAIHRQNGSQSASQDTVKQLMGPPYQLNENVEYQYMVIIDKGKGNQNNFRNALSDFNASMYASSALQVSTLMLDNQHQCVMVKNFESRKKALDYYNLLKSKPDIFKDLQPGTFQVMVISTENFALFFKDKNISAYKTFFDNAVMKK